MADLPQLPAPHAELAKYISENTDKSMIEILEPYRKYEANLRTVYAQDRKNPILDDPHLNVLPLFTDDTKLITTRARDLKAESEEEQGRYIMSLPDEKRRPHGSPATVANLSEFQKNFNVFSESSMVDMDWSNVVAAGSSVINCLLPIPKEFNTTKRKLREYYHEKFCPASDVDLFLYGLTHDQAIEKIKKIEQAIRDALLNEVTVVRTKYAITIASQYPVRHVQIVLRVYKSVSEILTGFDIDAAGGAYDGKQVYVTPRALGSFITQINHVDLTRRSPSYENRLSKYSHRNFEVYWPELDRSRIDPTIFERSFQRTLGLARLLVLERLPTTSARETYLNKRREERGRPQVYKGHQVLHGNIKDFHEDEIADWLSEEDISNYHTFTVPYGQHFNAKRIEKLCYTRDLLLNAEWNQSADREVYLHRHPAFFGRVEDVIEDCCGCCPDAVTPEEKEVAEKEAEIYIKGKVAFLIDDPGRQQIGSFNPLTEQDWTDMAYVGNTARLCQSIVDGDVDDVLNWLSQEDSDPNKRDYTGRSALHLAVMTSTPEVVRCLVDHGSRLTARLADGKTALHLAASRGNAEIIKILMEKSIENEEAEEERKDRKRQAAKTAESDNKVEAPKEAPDSGASEKSGEESDGELIDDETTDVDAESMATGSFVKVKKGEEPEDDLVPDEAEDEPDYFQIDVLSWDVPCSPLHLAIAEGHEDAVKLLCDYGADSILPVKFINKNNNDDTGAILTLVLALSLPKDKAKSMAKLLLKLGATSSQADSNGCTAFHRYIESGQMDLIDTILDTDTMGVKTAINHMVFGGSYWDPETIAPVHSAIENGDSVLVLKLLNGGATAQIDFETWLKAAKVSPSHSGSLGTLEVNQKKYKESTEQPLITAIRSGNVDVAIQLLEHGADPNALTGRTERLIFNEYQRSWNKGESVLDLVQASLKSLRGYTGEKGRERKPTETPGVDEYLSKFTPGTYSHMVVSDDVKREKDNFKFATDRYEKDVKRLAKLKGAPEKRDAINEVLAGFESLEKVLVSKGAKTFELLYPDIKTDSRNSYRSDRSRNEKKDSKPYEFHFSFNNDRDMTEKRRDGYIELMEAAWTGDMERIKSLALQAWGPEQDQPPLKIAVSDNMGNTPFSVAFLRGHHDIARALLEIVKAQWSPVEKEKVRFKMEARDDDEEEYSDDESDGSGDSEPRIVSEKVQQNFTIDDIGHVSMQVKSHTKPLSVICESVPSWEVEDGKIRYDGQKESLFVHVFSKDDNSGLKALLDMAQHYAGQKFEGEEEVEEGSTASFIFPHNDFMWAVEHGKSHQLALVIKRTGAGIPLDHLVKKSGVELKQKPRYYQGLTVYGKKRKDWATAGRNMVVRTTGVKTPPLLHAALAGSLESVEFFLGDAPHRLYSEFGKSKAAREDSRLRHLKDSPGGFDRAITKWLGADNELVMHCAVLAYPVPGPNANELLEYLVEACPGSLEKKNSQGDTPLMVACRLGRTEYVKTLLAANADQSVRNHKGENIIHAALAGNPEADQLRELLDLLDPSLRSHLFLQRKNLHENGTTPLHSWVSQASGVQPDNVNRYNRYNYYYNRSDSKPYNNREKEVVRMLQLLLEYSKGEELEMLNGAGDTCLHTAIMYDMLSLAHVLVSFRPRLLYRENAVGRTPAELARDRLTGQKFAKPSSLKLDKHNQALTVINKKPGYFAAEANPEAQTEEQRRELLASVGLGDSYSPHDASQILRSMGATRNGGHKKLDDITIKAVMWDLCRTAMEKNPENRRLVSLNEANDVAKRLGEKYSASRYFSIQARGEDEDGEDAEDKEDKTTDFATQQLNSRQRSAWDKTYLNRRDRLDSDEDDSSQSAGYCADCGEYH
ncbi:ankyrin repeat [Fusarium albosuccineum]|uniref:Ankyrin repeat n=1 Tax=Fusarium albosuccineum TaxID=1237068 RepID=A0A8H4PH55_9HYPO|nr:ankyrin repeat [Fusarium albosuccineum]